MWDTDPRQRLSRSWISAGGPGSDSMEPKVTSQRDPSSTYPRCGDLSLPSYGNFKSWPFFVFALRKGSSGTAQSRYVPARMLCVSRVILVATLKNM
ncbi:hypothetical protein JOB18_020918 [Solea senegalensis]|uniref:Uncharacterized protein n=1 Tax=Solea senegalensis TaxID=28829 RepID=A0AAV6QAV7_SOLSE|nr:hypothetical protein JOB18_020918 [Solea senegalensis]